MHTRQHHLAGDPRRVRTGGPGGPGGVDRSPAITVDGLTKRYGDKTVVDNLSFDIPKGVVTGFLGPNGSGKTTTIRMIFNLVHPTSGAALIDGRPFTEHAAPARHAGIMIDGAGVHPMRSARNHLRVIAAERGIAASRVDEVLSTVDLTEDADRKVRGFSLGMRQRLDLATALLGDAQLLVLDEPANGLDPAGIRWLRSFLRSFAESGRTVFVSSHQLGELSQLADEVVVINHGKLVTHTAVAALTTTDLVRVVSPDLAVLQPALTGAGGQVQAVADDEVDVTHLSAPEIGRIAAAHSAVLYELTPRGSSLEEVFLQMTREGETS